jgi:hypothetical protein
MASCEHGSYIRTVNVEPTPVYATMPGPEAETDLA